MTNDQLNNGSASFIVPRWFLQITGGAITLLTITFVPWTVWQTTSMIQLQVQMKHFEKMVDAFDAVKSEQIRRSSNVEAVNQLKTAFNQLDLNIRSIDKRVIELESKYE